MKKLKIDNVYQIAAIVIFIIGLIFTFIVAQSDDAPGFIIFRTAFTTGCCLILYGLGSFLNIVKNNNKLLNDIYLEIKKNNK